MRYAPACRLAYSDEVALPYPYPDPYPYPLPLTSSRALTALWL